MKKLFLVVIINILLISWCFNLKTKAATSNFYVSVGDSVLNMREKPSTSSKLITQLKNGSKVKYIKKVNSKWTIIQYKKEKGYVASKYLKKGLPSYKKDKKKRYMYLNTISRRHYTMKYDKQFENWYMIEDEKEVFYESQLGTEYFWTSIDDMQGSGGYEIKDGVSIVFPRNAFKGKKVYYLSKRYFGTVITTNKTLKTDAGTFKNVVVIKTKNEDKYYYAPNIGLVLSTDSTGKYYEKIVDIF